MLGYFCLSYLPVHGQIYSAWFFQSIYYFFGDSFRLLMAHSRKTAKLLNSEILQQVQWKPLPEAHLEQISCLSECISPGDCVGSEYFLNCKEICCDNFTTLCSSDWHFPSTLISRRCKYTKICIYFNRLFKYTLIHPYCIYQTLISFVYFFPLPLEPSSHLPPHPNLLLLYGK